jgi:hypothetical protein
MSRLGIVPCLIPVTLLVAFVFIVSWKQTHHEFLHLPGIVACRRGDTMSVEITPNQVRGHIETFVLGSMCLVKCVNRAVGSHTSVPLTVLTTVAALPPSPPSVPTSPEIQH